MVPIRACSILLTLGVAMAYAQDAEPVDDIAQMAKALPEIAAKYRAAGMPWLKGDLRNPNSGQNAFPLIKKYADRFKNLPYPDLMTDVEAGRFAAAEKGLSAYKEGLQLGLQASKIPRFEDDHDLDLGQIGIDFSGYAGVRFISGILAAQAELDAAQRHASSAAATLLAARKIAALLSQESSFMPVFVRIASDDIIDRAAQHCDGFLAHDPKGLQAINAAMSAPVASISLGYALRGEAYSQISALRNGMALMKYVGDSPVPKDIPGVRRSGFPSGRQDQGAFAGYLEMWIQVAPAVKRDDPIAIGVAFQKWTDEQIKHPRESTAITDNDAHVVPQEVEAVQRSIADKAVTRALGQALLYMCDHGRYPKSMAELPGSWTDPFTGNPLRIAHLNGGIRIYSLGVKKVDHHGLTSRETPGETDVTGWNIVAAYPPVKPGVNGIAHEK